MDNIKCSNNCTNTECIEIKQYFKCSNNCVQCRRTTILLNYCINCGNDEVLIKILPKTKTI